MKETDAMEWSHILKVLIVGNKVSAFIALGLVVQFTFSDQGEEAAMMIAAMLCNVLFVIKLEGIRREMR